MGAHRLQSRSHKEEAQFTQSAAAIFGSTLLADIALKGVIWTLERELNFNHYPKAGTHNSLGQVWSLVTHAILGVPTLVVMFALETPDIFVLLDVKAFPVSNPGI